MMRLMCASAMVVLAAISIAQASDTLTQAAAMPAAMTPPSSAPASGLAGHFRLQTPKGEVVDSDELSGKPYGLFFGFTYCPDVCPTTLTDMTLALGKLPAAKDFRIYFVTIDPERDTPQVMATYASNFDPRIVPLGGDRSALDEAIRSFGVVARKFEANGGYGFAHTASVYLVDGNGIIADHVSYADPTDKAVAKIAAVIAAN